MAKQELSEYRGIVRSGKLMFIRVTDFLIVLNVGHWLIDANCNSDSCRSLDQQ